MSIGKVFVEGLAADTVEEMVQLLFEDWRIGGGDVDDVQLTGNGSAYVTFAEPSVAEAFLAKSVLETSGLRLRISETHQLCTSVVQKDSADPVFSRPQEPANETQPDVLYVEAAPSLPSKDLLEIYFESKRASGGEIEKLTLNDDGRSATIVFKDLRVIWDVLKREHKIASTKLNVYALERLRELDGVLSCAVEVTGIPGHLNEDTLVMFFESRRHFDGDPVEAIYYDQTNGRAVLTYATPEVASRVSKRPSVILSGQSVQVNLLQPMPPPPIVVGATDKLRLLARYLPDTFADSEIAE